MSTLISSSPYRIFVNKIKFDDSLSAIEKDVLEDLVNLSRKRGYVVAGNKWFARRYNASIRTASRWISSLNNAQYLHTQIWVKDVRKRIYGRKIFVDAPLLKKAGIDVDKFPGYVHRPPAEGLTAEETRREVRYLRKENRVKCSSYGKAKRLKKLLRDITTEIKVSGSALPENPSFFGVSSDAKNVYKEEGSLNDPSILSLSGKEKENFSLPPGGSEKIPSPENISPSSGNPEYQLMDTVTINVANMDDLMEHLESCPVDISVVDVHDSRTGDSRTRKDYFDRLFTRKQFTDLLQTKRHSVTPGVDRAQEWADNMPFLRFFSKNIFNKNYAELEPDPRFWNTVARLVNKNILTPDSVRIYKECVLHNQCYRKWENRFTVVREWEEKLASEETREYRSMEASQVCDALRDMQKVTWEAQDNYRQFSQLWMRLAICDEGITADCAFISFLYTGTASNPDINCVNLVIVVETLLRAEPLLPPVAKVWLEDIRRFHRDRMLDFMVGNAFYRRKLFTNRTAWTKFFGLTDSGFEISSSFHRQYKERMERHRLLAGHPYEGFTIVDCMIPSKNELSESAHSISLAVA